LSESYNTSGEHLFLKKVFTGLFTRIMRKHAYFGKLIPTKKPAII